MADREQRKEVKKEFSPKRLSQRTLRFER